MLLLAVIIGVLPATASADILQWTDEAGVVHYTNLKAEVPAAARASALVDETARRPPAVSEVPVPDQSVPQPAAERSEAPIAQALYDQSLWLTAYIAGLQRGLAGGGAVASGGSVEINGPLAVSGSNPWPAAYS